MEELRNNLFYVINNSNLPLEAAYYVAKDVFRELEDTYKSYLIQQQEERVAAAQASQAQPEEPESDLPQQQEEEAED